MNKKVMIGIGIILLATVFIIIKLCIIPDNKNIRFDNKSNNNNSITPISTLPHVPDESNMISKNSTTTPDNKEKTKPSIENITIEVLPNTITKESVTILITDNNENKYSWGEPYKVQKKTSEGWKTLPSVSDMLTWTMVAYIPDENNQIKQKLNIKACYGELSEGTYRIVKNNGNSEEIYSNEFEIK